LGKVIAAITTSVDGFITGPDDGPGLGLGKGGERLHYWVMGGPWTYGGGHNFAMHGPDKDFYDELVAGLGAGIVGRGMYDAAGAWGGTNPFPGPLMVLTHRVEDQPAAASGFTFVSGLEEALSAGCRSGRRQGRVDRRRRGRDPAGAGRRAGGRTGALDGTGGPGRGESACSTASIMTSTWTS
jgi:dihydrofolate reductase